MEVHNISIKSFPRIQYRKAGKGPAVVLLHGFPEDGLLWRFIIPVLADSYTVLAPDIPGSGGSESSTENVSMESLADSIAGILDHEGIDRALITGHSMGGYIALAFADRFKQMVKGLSLVHSIATPDSEDKIATRRKSVELLQKDGGKEAFVKGMIPNLFARSFVVQHPEVIQQQTERGLQLSAEVMIDFYNAMINRPDRTNVLTEAAFPVQWIIGREDNVVPPESTLQQSRLANVNFVSVYQDCGHMSMLETPERLSADLREFAAYCYNR